MTRVTLVKRVKRALIPLYQHAATRFGGGEIKLGPRGRNAVILLCPDYGNIGDLAIRFAQERYLARVLPDYTVQSVPLADTYKFLRILKDRLVGSDLVLVTGGGSMGDLYPRAQFGRMFIARYLSSRRIVSFPQSIIFSSTGEAGRSGVREAKALSFCNQFVLTARESQSRRDMEALFSNRVIYAPDIVFSLIEETRAMPNIERSGALMMLRGDAERSLSGLDADVIDRRLRSRFSVVSRRDNTVRDELIFRGAEEKPFLAMLDDIRATEVVVTDRLHGMIFAVITGTPCIVLPNTNHKIRGTYDAWVERSCPYVVFLDRLDEAELDRALQVVTRPGATDAFATLTFDFHELDEEILAGSR